MKEETHEILDSKITLHDRHRFEVKIDVDLIPDKENFYQVETYFFLPRALNINSSTYTKTVFFNSSQRYIRFKTPQISLGKVIDPSVESSPMNRIKKNLPAILAGTDDHALIDATYSEIKLLGCMARGAIRDKVKSLLVTMAGIEACVPESAINLQSAWDEISKCLQAVSDLVEQGKALKAELSDPIVPNKLREAFSFYDEFLSLTIVDYLGILLESARKNRILDAVPAIDKEICALINSQNEYRRCVGYPSIIKPGTANESIIYRRSMLKKFISSVLFLQIRTSEWEGAFQLFFGLAAGLAMFLSLLVMAVAQTRYAVNSISFILIAAVTYMFKDRVKDWLRLWLAQSWTKKIADRKTDIRDPQTGQNIGTLKETFSFIAEENIPREILSRRNIDNITSIDEEGKPERVMKYVKDVSLYPARISKFHERLRDLNDILRFNVVPFLSQADDSHVEYLNLDASTNQLETIQCSRTYHVNIIIKYASHDSKGKERVSFERIRIVLSQDGISRLEEVPLS